MDLVDTHFHIWQLDKFDYPWPTAENPTLFRSIPIAEVESQMKETPVKHAVFIQVLNDCPEEAKWLMDLAKEYPFIKGIVAGLDLTSPNLEKVLDDLMQNPLFKGCRHILDFEDEKYITRDDVIQGLKVLESRGLTFDLLVRPYLLKYLPDVIKQVPNLKMVVNHIAKPYIKDKKISPWDEEIATIAQFPNVYCKISGLVPGSLVYEGDLQDCKKEDFQPYVDHIIKCFGIDRCMFASDCPVFYQANCKYMDVYNLLNNLLPDLSDEDRRKLFRENGKKFYNLQT